MLHHPNLACIYFCRQLFYTCGGLGVLLHLRPLAACLLQFDGVGRPFYRPARTRRNAYCFHGRLVSRVLRHAQLAHIRGARFNGTADGFFHPPAKIRDVAKGVLAYRAVLFGGNHNIMTVNILDVPFHGLSSDEALNTLLGYLNKPADLTGRQKNHLVVTPNPEAVMLAARNESYLRILQSADLVLPDGIGIVLAAKWHKKPIAARVTGCDITLKLLETAKDAAYYILGAAPGVADEAKQKLISKGVNVAGSHHGYFSHDEEKNIISEIQALKPDILLVGMGMPRQEEWAHKYLNELPCKITICIGGVIDIIAGKVPRAPFILQRMGLEWFYRLMREPSRFRRMIDLPKFACAVFKEPKQTFRT